MPQVERGSANRHPHGLRAGGCLDHRQDARTDRIRQRRPPLDHAAQGIRVNSLSPGGVETDRLVHRFGSMEQAHEAIAAKHILGRLGRPDEIAEGAVFLASDESSFMTGADLLIDGGYAAQ